MTVTMKHTRDNCMRSARSGALRGCGPLLAWLFCLALVVAALPVCATTYVETASYGIAACQPYSGCCGARTDGAAMGSGGTQGGPVLRAAQCEIPDPASSANGIRASRARRVKFVTNRFPRAEVVLDAPSPAVLSIIRDHALLSSFSDPSGFFPSANPGRAPPAAAHQSHL
jgi:hypothetical protein